MPELPNQPNDTNFTLEALSKKLEMIEQHPEQGTSRPMIFNEPSPGLASPAEPAATDAVSPKPHDRFRQNSEAPLAPSSTRMYESGSDLPSNALVSPSSNLSPLAKHASREEQYEEQVHADFESGGIRLKKKASVNFGAPFGSFAGFDFGRKMS